jgi:hypothetical protein
MTAVPVSRSRNAERADSYAVGAFATGTTNTIQVFEKI